MRHHLGSPALFREALIRAMVVGMLIIAGTVFAALPTQCAMRGFHTQHATRG